MGKGTDLLLGPQKPSVQPGVSQSLEDPVTIVGCHSPERKYGS